MRGSGGRTPLVFNVGVGFGDSGQLHALTALSWGENPWYPSNMTTVGPPVDYFPIYYFSTNFGALLYLIYSYNFSSYLRI